MPGKILLLHRPAADMGGHEYAYRSGGMSRIDQDRCRDPDGAAD